jgi:hypothetical protein
MEVTINKSNWHMMVDKAAGFNRSAFFETKDGIINYMCKMMHSKALRGHPIQVLRQDNAGENVKLVKTAKGKDWKLDLESNTRLGKRLSRICMQRHRSQLLWLNKDAC